MIIDADTGSIEVTPVSRSANRQLVEEIARYPVALIGDAVNRMGMMCSAISPKTRNARFAGVVLPVKTRDGDNLAIHRALDDAQTGDVLVVSANEERNRAVFGDILGELCVAKGVVAAVVDGAVRDLDDLDEQRLPVFSRAVSPAGPSKYGPETVGVPIACGGVVCNGGDVIFGDRDGVIVLRPDSLRSVLARIHEQAAVEGRLRARIRDLKRQ